MSIVTSPVLEINSPIVTDQSDFNASCARYEKQADLKLRNSDTIVLGGYGAFMKVINGSFCVEYARPHEPGVNKMLKLNRGVHKIKQIVIMVKGGYVTLDALEWCVQQGITIYLMGYRGDVLQVITPKQSRNVKLSYLQMQATQTDLVLSISVELIRRKTQSQLETLARYPHLERQPYAVSILESGLCELNDVLSIERLRTLEGKLAGVYFSVFNGIPIKWETKAAKIVPEHWLSITERTSPLSHAHGAWKAVNVFHTVLNFAYSFLECQVMQAINIAGLEPSIPFLHAYQEGKNALAWDMMEVHRAAVDHLVLSLFQKTTFKKGDFVQDENGQVSMGNEEIKRWVLASCRIPTVDIDRQIRWLRSTLESS